jgi:hypothetical protein
MSVELGTIKSVRMREIWKHEEHDFTPWLASEENIARLSDAVGLELQVEGVEVAVGPFTADILAKDPYGGYVVIENQFGKTDHDHFGKLLTYAATLGAKAVIWIAEHFTDEHRKLVEWLNERTGEELSLFAVEAELLMIDSSRPALRFNVLAEPTEIARQAVAVRTSGGSITAAQRLQFDFWTAFRELLLKRKVVANAQAARPQYWYDVPIGRSGFVISNLANTTEGRIGTRLYLSNKVADVALAALEREKAAIEAEIGEPLQWTPRPDKRDRVILVARAVDLEDRSQWPEYCEWLVELVAKFKRAFGGRIKALDLSTPGSVANSTQVGT